MFCAFTLKSCSQNCTKMNGVALETDVYNTLYGRDSATLCRCIAAHTRLMCSLHVDPLNEPINPVLSDSISEVGKGNWAILLMQDLKLRLESSDKTVEVLSLAFHVPRDLCQGYNQLSSYC